MEGTTGSVAAYTIYFKYMIYTLITDGMEVGQGGLERDADGGCRGRWVAPVTLTREKFRVCMHGVLYIYV